jgi:hypothetical protein
MIKNNVLIGFIGLSRTFKKTASNIFKNIIDNNRDQFNFSICINTDPSNLNRYSLWRKQQLPQEVELDINLFENTINEVYNINGQLKHITYFTINDIKNSGPSLLKKRINIILDKELNNNYDIYIFIRMDCIINKPINLHDFKSKKNKHKFSIITGGEKNIKRMDHWYDWDYCWIGDKFSMELWVKENFNNYKHLNYKSIIDLSKIIKLKGRYLYNIKICKDLYYHWSRNLWEIMYNMYLENCEISFNTENNNIFCEIVRN